MPRPTRKLLNSQGVPQRGRRFVRTGRKLLSCPEERLSITNRWGRSRRNLCLAVPCPAPAQTLCLNLLKCRQPPRQARLVAGSRVLVQHALLDCLVESRRSLLVGLTRRYLVALFQALTHIPQSGAQLRCIGPVAGSPFRCLTGAFQRRKMI